MSSGTLPWARERNIALACGHVLEFAGTNVPERHEILWCPRCKSEEVQAEDSYIISCQQCRYSRNRGADLLTAQNEAGIHARRKNHSVHVVRGRAIISRHSPADTEVKSRFGSVRKPQQLTLSDLDEPPF